MPRRLTNYEQETIINFNKVEDIAHIFTYEQEGLQIASASTSGPRLCPGFEDVPSNHTV